MVNEMFVYNGLGCVFFFFHVILDYLVTVCIFSYIAAV